MNGVIYTHATQADLQDIWACIAQHDPEAADALDAGIRAEAQHLAELPSLGHRRRDLTPHDLWFRTVRKNYLIVYPPRRAAGNRAHSAWRERCRA